MCILEECIIMYTKTHTGLFKISKMTLYTEMNGRLSSSDENIKKCPLGFVYVMQICMLLNINT